MSDRKAAREFASLFKRPLEGEAELYNLAAAFLEVTDELAALRELHNIYNLGGMTDYNDRPMKRALAAEQRAADLQRRLEEAANICEGAASYWDAFTVEGGELPNVNKPAWLRECARKIRALSAQPNAAAGQEDGQLCNAKGTPEAPESRPTPSAAPERECDKGWNEDTNVYRPVAPASSWPTLFADAEALRIEGLELAAGICEDYEDKSWDAYKNGHYPDRANPHTQGAANGASDCAKAIRDEIAKRTPCAKP